MPRRLTLLIVVSLIVVSQAAPRSAEQTLIAAGAVWKFNDSGANLGTTWRAVAFDDSGWAAGAAQLGYGDGDEATVVSYGGNATQKYITTYFRRAFSVPTPAVFASLMARFVRDDGGVIYLNGVEIARSNMPAGAISSTTLAPVAVGNAEESQWFEVPVDPSLLVAGTNVVAVELHQQAATSSDISFNFELRGTEVAVPPPTVSLAAPTDHGVSNQNSITFTASATAPAGLATATLLVSGPPRSVSFSGPGQIEDAQITADTPSTPGGTGVAINVDGQTPHAHGLVKVLGLVGGGAGQVPAGAVIQSATLQVNCTNIGNVMSVYRLNESWVENETTWSSRQAGVAWTNPGADGATSRDSVAVAGSCSSLGPAQVNVTRFVQDWSNGAPNHGLVLTDSGTDGIDFDSTESGNSPTLIVIYKDSLIPLATQTLTGTTASISFPASVPQAGTWFWNVRVTDAAGAASSAPADFEFTMDPLLPDEPVLVSPLNGAAGVPPAGPLETLVGNPSGGALTVSARIRRAAGEEFTIIVVPDTQHYSESFPAIFTSQTQWIRDNKVARNIVFVTHEGDIVQNASSVPEWDRANTSMSVLDGVVPYGMGPGNHDQPTTLYNQYFPFTRYSSQPWYGGHYPATTNDNNFQLFSGGGLDFVITHLEFCPPAGAVSWASSVLNSYPNRIGMMTTHGYLNESAQRTVHGCTNTQYLWDGLALTSPNLHFMLSGHVHDESRRVDTAHGHPVYQMLADYQSRAQGGEGWLRIMRFVPAEDRIYVQTYSPWLNQFETDANSEFTLSFPMGGAWTDAGTTTAASGETATIIPAGLLPSTNYEWQATVTNASGKSRTGPVWRFTTGTGGGPVNQPPTAVGESYSVQSGSSLTVTAPGVLSNDTDVDGPSLAAELLTAPANGALNLAPNGSFVYTPSAGYAGSDSFTYRASDGLSVSAPAVVSLTVVAPPPVTVVDANFNSSSNSFTYLDDAFRGTAQPSYAAGSRITSGGFSGGALRVYVGGVNNTTVTNMSGGWQRPFTLAAPVASVVVTFRYLLNQENDYESDEFSQMLASLNGALIAPPPGETIAQLTGNGNGGSDLTTGWRQVTITLGPLAAGTHQLRLGGFNNKKNNTAERTTILIDDVTVVVR